MRVGFDARWYNDSGVGSFVLGLLKGLAELDSDIETIAFESPTNPVPVDAGKRLTKFPARSAKYSVGEQFELPRLIDRHRVDVFFAPFYIVPQFARCPIVASLLDLAPFKFPIYGRAKSFIVQQGYKHAARRSDFVVTISHSSERDIAEVLRVPMERIRVIYPGIDNQLFHPSATSDEEEDYLAEKFGVRPPYVLVIGARNWKTKNINTALRAIADSRARTSERFGAVLVGPQDVLAQPGMKDLADKIGLVSTGFVSSEDLALFYRHASVFVFPSRYEGFGLPVVEAMSSGCAVVTSTGGSLAEIAGEGAIKVSPDDCSGFADAIADLMSDSTSRARWRELALRRSRDFSYAKAAQALAGVLREANASRRR